MAPYLHRLALLLLCFAIAAAATVYDFRADLRHPYAGSLLSSDEVFRHAARASKDRATRLNARLVRVLCKGGDISMADAPIAPLSGQGHTLTVGIGTPPQPHTLIVDTGSNLIWTQCKLFRRTAKQREPLYDPAKSLSFAFVPCSSRLCQEGQFSSEECTRNVCFYDDVYGNGSAEAYGVLSSDTFTFGVHTKVSIPLGFGCGALSSGRLDSASGILGLSPESLSLISQLSIPKFSYCLTPFAERTKTSPLLFGAMADLQRYRTTGPIQTTSILRNPVKTMNYYVPLVGLSLGTKQLSVPASSLAIKPDGTGGTVVDSGSTVAHLVETAFQAVKKAVLETLRLPVVNRTVDDDYELCFALPSGVAMGAVQMPPLVLHFGGGAAMTLPRDNYFQEPRAGLMCLAMGEIPDGSASVIGNVQLQNMHVLFDVRNQKFSFAPAQCDHI